MREESCDVGSTRRANHSPGFGDRQEFIVWQVFGLVPAGAFPGSNDKIMTRCALKIERKACEDCFCNPQGHCLCFHSLIFSFPSGTDFPTDRTDLPLRGQYRTYTCFPFQTAADVAAAIHHRLYIVAKVERKRETVKEKALHWLSFSRSPYFIVSFDWQNAKPGWMSAFLHPCIVPPAPI